MKILSIIIQIMYISVLMIGVIFGIWITFNIMSQVYHPNNLLDQCRDYEADRSIPTGSCDCALRIYPNFNKSYDWMDACEIEKAKKNNV